MYARIIKNIFNKNENVGMSKSRKHMRTRLGGTQNQFHITLHKYLHRTTISKIQSAVLM